MTFFGFLDIKNSDNAYLYDKQGKQYIDMSAGIWVASIGHNNKFLNKILSDQMSLFQNYRFKKGFYGVDFLIHYTIKN